MTDRDPHPDSLPDNDNEKRTDVEQIVEAREDADERGEGGREPDSLTSASLPDGVGGTGGITTNQDDDAR